MVVVSWRHSPGARAVQRTRHPQPNLDDPRRSSHVQGALPPAHRERLLHDYLQNLYDQAAAPRQLQAAWPSSGAASPHSQPGPTRGSQGAPARNAGGSSAPGPSFGSLTAAPSAGPAVWSSAAALQETKNPSLLAFEAMYQQLAVWRSQHLSCHIPRNCFDAPPLLSAWVRHMRRLHRALRLPAWAVERLSMLGFEWKLDDASAKWINMYHQMRRYRALYGHTSLQLQPLPPNSTSQDRAMAVKLSRWLAEQAELFAAGKLTQQQKAMLQLLGVALTIPVETAEQMVLLQGLNAHERKLLRRKFRGSGGRSGSASTDQRHRGAKHSAAQSSYSAGRTMSQPQ